MKELFSNNFIHNTAVIDKGAVLGHGCKIWHWVHICSNSKIGSNVIMGQNVFVGNNAVIGNNCKIQNNVSIYSNVILEDDVFCGPSMVFTNIDRPRAFIEKKNQFLNTLVEKGATLGANCTIICGNTIGRYAFIAAGSVVTKNVPPYALMVGVPSKQTGWVSKNGEKLNLPLFGDMKIVCQKYGDKYHLKGNRLIEIT